MNKLIFTLFLIIPSLIVFPQDTINVPGDYSTIQAGINAAKNGDLVLVEDGTYLENINYRGKAITVASNFIIDGDTNHINNTIIDGSQPSHPDSGSVVTFDSGEDTTSVICGFTITSGTGSYHETGVRNGGGIKLHNSGAKIINNIIINNRVASNSAVTSGGGIGSGPIGNNSWVIVENNFVRRNIVNNTGVGGFAAGGGIALVQNVKVNFNTVDSNMVTSADGSAWGGGIVLTSGGQSLFRYCIGNTILNNKALTPTSTAGDGGVGGGLVIAGSPKAEIRMNDIRYNEIESNTGINQDCWGGGVLLQNQTEETIFDRNYVAFNKGINNSFCKGAGIAIWNFNVAGGPQLVNNIIKNNIGGTMGGGIYSAGIVQNSSILINNTIYNNEASQGGAIYIGRSNSTPANVKVINSILWNNGSSIVLTGGSTVTVRYSDVEGGYTGLGNLDNDPLFSDTLFNLSDFSPCIGAGIDSIQISGIWYYAPPFDFDGDPRPNPSMCMPDIGAQESPKCDTTTNINEIQLEIPKEFSLSQNYPNPFNPQTTIQLELPIDGFVSLKIYNVLGQEVATLVSDNLSAGSYKYVWDAKGLTSGIYFYQLKTEGFVETNKMQLLK